MLAENRVGLVGGYLADEQVPPANFAAVGLQLDRPGLHQRRGVVVLGRLAVPPVVIQPGVIDDQLVVETDRHPLADHEDAEMVPLPNGLSASTSGSLPGEPGLLFHSPPLPLSAPSCHLPPALV